MPFYKKNKAIVPRSKRLQKLAQKNGLRHSIFNTVGDKYKGEWKEDKKSGKGILLTRNKELYEGDFDLNRRHGFGVLAYEIPGIKVYSLAYRGSWKNGWPEGHGLRIYKDGSCYLGQWKKGKRHGHGQMWYADKSWYDGDWVNDQKQGLGILLKADGNRYEGSWCRDKKHGEGRFFFLETGQIQDGVWQNDYCTFSVMCDIPFRQTAIRPTVYPIPVCCLINRDQICTNQKLKCLMSVSKSCLSLPSDYSMDKLHVQYL